MAVEDWPGVRGQAFITDQGAVFGGDLYWWDGGPYDGEYYEQAQDYTWYEEPCRSYTDDCD